MRPAEERDFRRFAESSTPELLRIAGALTGSQAAAEQLVTAVLAALARRWQRLGDDLAEPAVRLLYQRYLRGGGTAPLELDTLDPSATDPADPRLVEARLRHAALRQLDPRSRALLTLRYLQQCTDAEAAKLLGSGGPVGGEIDRALARVRSVRAGWGQPGGSDPAEVAADVRGTVHELAGAVRPADLAGAALAAARRHRRTRVAVVAGSAFTAAALVAAVAVAALGGEPEPAPGPDLTGRSVVTGYGDDQWYVLDPGTGEYRPSSLSFALVSPDLRSMLGSQHDESETVFEIAATTDHAPVARVSVPGLTSEAAWSPDSARIAVALVAEADPILRRLAVIEVATQRLATVDLALPPGRSGSLDAPLVWLDLEQLAIPTGEVAGIRAHAVNERPDLPVDAVSIFDLTGALTDELPIHQDGETGAPGWVPHGRLADGRYLLARAPRPDALELAAVDLATDPGPYRTVTLPLGDAPEGSAWRPYPAGWFGTTVYVRAALISGEQNPRGAGILSHAGTYFVDVATGEVEVVNLGTRFGLPVAGNAAISEITFGDAAGLAPGAAYRAFPP